MKSSPERIIFATASRRKMMVISWLLAGTDPATFLLDEGWIDESQLEDPALPLQMQAYFDAHIYNGDGQIKGDSEMQVGSYEINGNSIPVFIRPSDGETSGNNPIQEAQNKANALAQVYLDEGQDVLVIGMDTVDKPNTTIEPLGKPEKTNEYGEVVLERVKDYSDDQKQIEDDIFKAYYLYTFFLPGTEIVHSNGISVVRTINESKNRDRLVQLHASIDDNLFEILDVFLDCGGGGVTQQSIRWVSSLDRYFIDDQKPSHWESLTISEQRWIVFFQIIGIPLWAVLEEIDTMFKEAETEG